MGIIKKQSIYGTIYTYIGALLGFVVTGILFTRILAKDEIGLLNILLAYAGLYGQVGSLGMSTTITRMFSYFRSKTDNYHNGFLFLSFIITVFGLILSLIVFFYTKSWIVDDHSSPLLNQYYLYIIPLIVFPFLFFKLFDSYSKVLFRATRGIFLKEVLPRIFVLTIITLYGMHIIDFNQLVALYVIAYCVPTLILFILLISEKQFKLKPDFNLLDKKMILTIASVSLFGIIISAAGEITLKIDRIMIEKFLDLNAVGVYSIAFFFGTMIILPARSVIKISSAVVAESWKGNDINNIRTIYSKSSLTQLIVGVFIFIGIWANIDNIIIIMTRDFSNGRYVIFFIGLAYLCEMSMGVSNTILATSRYYKMQGYLLMLMVVLIIISNIIFIPLYGIVGAAFAAFISKIIVLIIRWMYLWRKFRLQPYSVRSLWVVIFAALAFLGGWIIPVMDNFIADIIIRSFVIALIFGLLIYFSKVSEDINQTIDNILRKLGIVKS